MFKLKMVLASHYILMDLLNLMEKEKVERLGEVCDCYSGRYSDDEEFQDIVSTIVNALEKGNNGVLEELKPRIKESIASRKIDTSGGTKLWFSNRRSFE